MDSDYYRELARLLMTNAAKQDSEEPRTPDSWDMHVRGFFHADD